MTHTLVRIVGFGKQVLLDPPSSARFCADGSLECRRGSRFDVVHEGQDEDVSDTPVDPCPEAKGITIWQIETSLFRHDKVDDFTVVSNLSPSPSVYDLICERSLVYLQGPFVLSSLPPIEALIGSGEEEIDRNFERKLGIRVRYVVDGEAWIASRCLLVGGRHYVLLSAQAPESEVECMNRAVARIVGSFSWM